MPIENGVITDGFNRQSPNGATVFGPLPSIPAGCDAAGIIHLYAEDGQTGTGYHDRDVTAVDWSTIFGTKIGPNQFGFMSSNDNAGGGLNYLGFTADDNLINGLQFASFQGNIAPIVAGILFRAWKTDGGSSIAPVASTETVATWDNGTTNPMNLYGDGSLELGGSAALFYIGDKDTYGSWRFMRSGDDLVIQQREAGVWNTKDTISGA